MPKKSVRDMRIWERQHFSLESKVFRATVMGAIVFGSVALLIALSLYVVSLVRQYISASFGLAKSTALFVEQEMDPGTVADEVMRIYHGLSETERQNPAASSYHEKFSEVRNSEEYGRMERLLNAAIGTGEVDDLYVGCYDEKTQALVFVCVPANYESGSYTAGGWETVSSKEIEKFLHWDGENKLYHISRTEDKRFLCTSGMPIKGGNGRTVCFMLADVTLRDVAHGIRDFLVQFTLALYIVVCVVGFLMSRKMKNMTSTPINKIADAARQYVEDRIAGNPVSDHFSSLEIHTGDEVENLYTVMSDMEEAMTGYENNLTRITAERERISTELSLASRIQTDMLPSDFPAFPDRKEFDIYATMEPAKEVGGDFYDFFLIDEDHLALVMADVSGKGIPAALFMMVAKILIQNYAMLGNPPEEVLRLTNEAVCKHNREEMFVTVWMGILEISTGKLSAANAGHEYPVLSGSDGKLELLKDKHGLVIGYMDGMRYKAYELMMKPGDRLFLYTDGVPEATSTESELFGTERMLEALNREPDASPEQLLQNVRAAVDSFVDGADQFDDITMMTLTYRGTTGG